MADKEANKAGEEGATKSPPKKKGSKLFAIVGALMAVEGVAIFAVVSMMNKTPTVATAAGIEAGPANDQEATVEVKLVEEKFQNMQTGRVWLWDTAIYMKVRQKHQDFVKGELEKRSAEINEEVARIFRRAQHAHLKEPGLETITRQLTVFASKTFGADSGGNPRVERVMIPRCKGFPTD